MRLLGKEHEDILKLMEQFYPGEEVLFVKKKGWILIRVGSETFFFHRKKVTSLLQGQFREGVKYFYRAGGETKEVDDWEGVKLALEHFLDVQSKLIS